MKSMTPWVLAGRAILSLLSFAAVVSAFLVVTREQAENEVGTHYVCPMHPEVVANAPGQCPICRMALEHRRSPLEGGSRSAPSQGFTLGSDAPTPLHSETGELALRHVFSEELRAPAWFESEQLIAAILYKDESSWQALGETANFSLGTEPTKAAKVERTAHPPAPWDATMVVVYFRPIVNDSTFRAGDVGWIRTMAEPHEALAIPNAAVLYSEEGSQVLTPSADHRTFMKKRVELGRVVNGFARVVSGLRDNERIAIGDVFFLDAEYRLRSRGLPRTGASP